jgi:Fe-S-cluster containining protein
MILLDIPPDSERLGLSDSFRFACHSGLSCFNRCCRKKHLPLTPYDVLRLRRATGLHSDEFLTRYTLYALDPGSGFPVISIKLDEAREGRCPFVTDAGCKVYEDRPTACRLYPLARASAPGKGRRGFKELFFLLDTPSCLGRNEDVPRVVENWILDQGLGPYLKMNDPVVPLVFHPSRDRNRPLDERQLQKIMVSCYNLDLFREFVFTTSFFKRYPLDRAWRERVKKDDTALLSLAYAYLDRALYATGEVEERIKPLE